MTVPSPRPGRPAPPSPPSRPWSARSREEWARRWGRGRAGEVVPAVAALVVTVVMSAVAVKPGDRPLWPGGLALIAVTTLPLVWRRRHPVVLLVVATVVPPLYYPLGYPDGPIAFVFLVALFNAAVQCRLAVSLGAVIVVNAGFLTTSAVRGGGGGDPDAVADPRGVASLSLALLVTIGVGQYVRGRRIRLEEAERRAAEAERGREEEALRREAQERLRIARELHDVLAHQISLINVQAGAALHRRDDAARAYAALEAIKAASRQTLRELRGVLGVLRQVDEAGGAGPVEPVPSLARVGELLERTRAAGLRVRRAGDLAAASSADAAADDGEGGGEGGGALAGVPAPVGLAGYRIVQEALTNVVRHAGAASVTVDVRCTADAVIVQIDDDGAGPPRDSAGPGGPSGPGGRSRGNGLRGMRERAAAVGGELAAGPGPDGGFRVRARLPLDAPSGAGRGRDEGAGEQVADGEPMREDT